MKINSYQRTPKQKSFRTPILSTVIVVALIAAGLAVWQMRRNDNNQIQQVPNAQQNVNLSPATPQEKSDANQRKEDIVKQDAEQKNQTDGNKIAVTPVIVDANQSQVRAYVPGVVQDGGTCTYQFTSGSLSFTKTSEGLADATTTRCTNLKLTATDFSQKGSWSVTVSYSSGSAAGTSSKQTFEVK